MNMTEKKKRLVYAFLWYKGNMMLVPCPFYELKYLLGLPGGEVKERETPEKALERMFREDWNIQVAIGGRICRLERDMRDEHSMISCYFCTVRSGKLNAEKENTVKWIPFISVYELSNDHPVEGCAEMNPDMQLLVRAVFESRWLNRRRESEKRKALLLFEYGSFGAWGCVGEYGGDKIRVYESGKIEYSTHLMGYEETPLEIRTYHAAPAMLHEIEDVIASHEDDLKGIPSELNNGSCDGSMQQFVFGQKKIFALNISRTDPAEIKARNPGYYEGHIANMLHENLVMDIFEEIAAVFNRYHTGISYCPGRGFHPDDELNQEDRKE
ncbi:MAG: NUDIX domain-containing protein [Clostridiales bacterium]|nr:NUDIX domain-containing protein [Clostridiales bacterium]